MGCVHLLATVPSAAVNTHEQIFEYKFSILWGIYLEAGLLGLRVLSEGKGKRKELKVTGRTREN